MNTLICLAIQERRLIDFSYAGGFRKVEPYVHGTSEQANEVLSGFQVAGHSASGRSIGWKMFEVEKMEHLTILPETFAVSRSDYNPRGRVMAWIHCQV
jgi:hypothetical protein